MSEWAFIDWAERTALPELLGVCITKTIHMLDRLRLGRGKDGELEKPLVILDAGFASKAEQRFLKDAAGVCDERIAKGRLKDAAKIERAISFAGLGARETARLRRIAGLEDAAAVAFHAQSGDDAPAA